MRKRCLVIVFVLLMATLCSSILALPAMDENQKVVFLNNKLFEKKEEEDDDWYGRVENLRLQYAESETYSVPADRASYICYAYAIGLKNSYYPGHYSGGSFSANTGIGVFASLVKADLQSTSYGYHCTGSYIVKYKCVKVQSAYPSNAGSWSGVIATKKSMSDTSFHFAKKTQSGWLHKVEVHNIMRFTSNSYVSNNYIWTNECYDDLTHIEPTAIYDSNIRFILFKPNHGTLISEYTGENYHSGSRHYFKYVKICNDCQESQSTFWKSIPCNGNPCVAPESVPITHQNH